MLVFKTFNFFFFKLSMNSLEDNEVVEIIADIIKDYFP